MILSHCYHTALSYAFGKGKGSWFALWNSTHSVYVPPMFLVLTFTGSNSSAKPSLIFSYFSVLN